jgi:hypothetical protein
MMTRKQKIEATDAIVRDLFARGGSTMNNFKGGAIS